MDCPPTRVQASPGVPQDRAPRRCRHHAPAQGEAGRAGDPDRRLVVVADPGPQQAAGVVAGDGRGVHGALAAVVVPAPAQPLLAVGARPGGDPVGMAPAHRVDARAAGMRHARRLVGARLHVVVRGDLVGRRRPRARRVEGSQLPQPVAGEVVVDRLDPGDVALERPVPAGVVVVRREHRLAGRRTVVEAEAVPQLVGQDALHVELAGVGVVGNEVPRCAVDRVAAVEDDRQGVVAAEGRRQARRAAAEHRVHLDQQFPRGRRGRGRVTPELRAQVDAREVHPAGVRVDDGVGERSLPGGVDALLDEGLPVDQDAGP